MTSLAATPVIIPPSNDGLTDASGVIWGTLVGISDPASFDRTQYKVAVYSIDSGISFQGYAACPTLSTEPNPDSVSPYFSVTGQWTLSIILAPNYAVALVSADFDAPADSLPTVDGDSVMSVQQFTALDDIPEIDSIPNDIPFPSFLGSDGNDGYRVCYNHINGFSLSAAPPDNTQSLYAILQSSTATEYFSNTASLAQQAGVDEQSIIIVVYQIKQWWSMKDSVNTLFSNFNSFDVFEATPEQSILNSVANVFELKSADKTSFDWLGFVEDLIGLGLNLVEPGMGTIAEDAFNAVTEAGDVGTKVAAQFTQKVISWGLKEGIKQGFSAIPSGGTLNPENLLDITISELSAAISDNFTASLKATANQHDLVDSNWCLSHMAFNAGEPDAQFVPALVSKSQADYTNIVWSKLGAACWYVKAEFQEDDGWPQCDTWDHNLEGATKSTLKKLGNNPDVLYVDHSCCHVFRACKYSIKKQSDDSVVSDALDVLWGSDSPGIGLSSQLPEPYPWGLSRIDILTNAVANWSLNSGFQVRVILAGVPATRSILPTLCGSAAFPQAKVLGADDIDDRGLPVYNSDSTIMIYFSNFTTYDHIAFVQGPAEVNNIAKTINLNELGPAWGLDGGATAQLAGKLGQGDFDLYPYNSEDKIFGAIVCSVNVNAS